MGARERRGSAASVRLAVQLHDLSSDLAVGIALLKGWKESGWSGEKPDAYRTIEVFEQVLVELRQLSRAVSDRVPLRSMAASVRESLEREAMTAGVDLELRLTGNESWLSGAQAELVRLVGREAIRNVKRHSGVSSCRAGRRPSAPMLAASGAVGGRVLQHVRPEDRVHPFVHGRCAGHRDHKSPELLIALGVRGSMSRAHRSYPQCGNETA